MIRIRSTYAVVAPLVLVVTGMCTDVRAQTRARGIDVSQFQGTMNWSTAYNQGVRFAFIRATRGPTTGIASVNDTRLTVNVPAARAAGILAGVYHYSRPDVIAVVGGQPTDTVVQNSAKDEASHFVNIAGAYMGNGYLRPVLDLEERGGAGGTTALNPTKLTLWANTFIDEVHRLSGAEPMVYMNTNYASNHVTSALAGRELWIANWEMSAYGNPLTTGSPPTGAWTGAGKPWSFWQYDSPNGLGATYGAQSVDIDLNVARGDLAFVQTLVVPEPGVAGLGSIAFALVAGRRRRVPTA